MNLLRGQMEQTNQEPVYILRVFRDNCTLFNHIGHRNSKTAQTIKLKNPPEWLGNILLIAGVRGEEPPYWVLLNKDKEPVGFKSFGLYGGELGHLKRIELLAQITRTEDYLDGVKNG
jgi:hypothetical protein